MSRSAFTLRLPDEERAALESLSKLEGRPMNQLLNEAVRMYLGRQRPQERDMEKILAQLKAYRERDPEFREAIHAFVKAELSYDDPLDDMLMIVEEPKKTGPAQQAIRELLSA